MVRLNHPEFLGGKRAGAPLCELLPLSAEAYICSYERTFRAACARSFAGVWPNWKAKLLRRPRRMEE